MHQKLLKADRLLNKKRPELSTQLCVEALLGLDFNCSDEVRRIWMKFNDDGDRIKRD